jgi:hypothetical protein
MKWELVSLTALGVVGDEYLDVDIESVKDTAGSLRSWPDEGLHS